MDQLWRELDIASPQAEIGTSEMAPETNDDEGGADGVLPEVTGSGDLLKDRLHLRTTIHPFHFMYSNVICALSC